MESELWRVYAHGLRVVAAAIWLPLVTGCVAAVMVSGVVALVGESVLAAVWLGSAVGSLFWTGTLVYVLYDGAQRADVMVRSARNPATR